VPALEPDNETRLETTGNNVRLQLPEREQQNVTPTIGPALLVSGITADQGAMNAVGSSIVNSWRITSGESKVTERRDQLAMQHQIIAALNDLHVLI
jgi:hypothetical protein